MLRKNGLKSLPLALLVLGSLTGCVKDELDLSKDIDMTVTVGENKLTIPTSSTAEFTLAHILNIKANSSIKTVEQDGMYGLSVGDYVLVQSGSPTQSSVKINPVSLSGLVGSTEVTKLDPIAAGSTPEVNTGVIVNKMTISDDNVTDEVVKLKEATTDIELEAHVSYESSDYSGTATLRPGFTITFDPSWTVTPVSDYLESVSKNVLRVKDGSAPSFSKTSDLVLKFKIAYFVLNPDATKNGADGLYSVGHFLLKGDAKFEGNVGVVSNSINGQANLNLKTVTKIPTAKLTSVIARVNPKINADPTSFVINDIPDAFTGEDNNLDLSNPQFYLTVSNASPVKVSFNAMLTPYDKNGKAITNASGQSMAVGIGEQYGTAAIEIPANASNYIICVSRTGQAGQSGASQIVTQANLSNLMLTIPHEIKVEFDTQADSKNYYDITLGQNYAVNSAYEAVIPFSFGENMHFSYETQDDEWGEDLEKYNFNQVVLTTTVVNTIPLKMTPTVYALDRQGNVINDIEVVIDGSAAPGSLSNPSSTVLKATLTSHAANIKNLDGVKVSFTAEADASSAGQALNSQQSVKFNDIKVTVTGGVTIDLN